MAKAFEKERITAEKVREMSEYIARACKGGNGGKADDVARGCRTERIAA